MPNDFTSVFYQLFNPMQSLLENRKWGNIFLFILLDEYVMSLSLHNKFPQI